MASNASWHRALLPVLGLFCLFLVFYEKKGELMVLSTNRALQEERVVEFGKIKEGILTPAVDPASLGPSINKVSSLRKPTEAIGKLESSSAPQQQQDSAALKDEEAELAAAYAARKAHDKEMIEAYFVRKKEESKRINAEKLREAKAKEEKQKQRAARQAKEEENKRVNAERVQQAKEEGQNQLEANTARQAKRDAKNVQQAEDEQQKQSNAYAARKAEEEKLVKLYKSDAGLQISRKHKVMFVHIPKSGGSTIERSNLFREERMDTKAQLPKAGGHEHVSVFKQQEGVEDFTSFAILRHPCERFISAFNFLSKGGQNDNDQEYAKIYIGNATLEEWVLHHGIRDDYLHLEPMWTFLFEPTAEAESGSTEMKQVMGVDEIFCQEKFHEATDWVNSNYDGKYAKIFPKVPHLNRGSPHSSCDQLSTETRQAIEDFYELDYCVFGYKPGIGKSSPDFCPARGKSKQYFTNRRAWCQRKIAARQSQ